MKKFFVVATAIYLLFLSFLAIVTCTFSFIGLAAKPDSLPPGFSPLVLLIFYIPFISWLIATGVGLFLKKGWARYSILVMSGFAIFTGVIFCLIFSLMPFPQSETTSESFIGIIKVFFVIVSAIFLIALPIVYFIFFTRPTVKELFTFDSKPVANSNRPVGISILAILYLFGATISIGFALFPMYPTLPLFGRILLSGWSMRVYQMFIGVIALFIAYGFWKRLKAAWICFIIISGYGIITAFINYFALNAEMFQKIMPQNTFYPINPVIMKIGTIAGLAVSIGLLAYVVKKRVYFYGEKLTIEDQPHPDESNK